VKNVPMLVVLIQMLAVLLVLQLLDNALHVPKVTIWTVVSNANHVSLPLLPPLLNNNVMLVLLLQPVLNARVVIMWLAAFVSNVVTALLEVLLVLPLEKISLVMPITT